MVKKKASEPALLSRNGVVTGWRSHVDITGHVEWSSKLRQRLSGVYLVISGTLDEPLGPTTAFEMQLSPGEVYVPKTGTPSVGMFLKAKPVLDGVAQLTPIEYQALLTLAASGHLRHCRFGFEKPRYGHADIVFFGFGSEPNS